MTSSLEYNSKTMQLQNKVVLPTWQRIILLLVLGYEAAGCLAGGGLLLAAPDGRLMDMPVDIMHNVFPNFMVPGTILFLLGILNAFAFFSVLRRTSYDWFIAGLGLGGLYIWFVVEIIILKELHWLHAMWGIPVLLGWVMAIPLIVSRHDTMTMRKALLTCGIVSSLWYVAINIFVPLMYRGYDSLSFTVSELSAIGAPTRILWVLLVIIHPLLFAAFGWAVWQSAGANRYQRIAGILIIVYSIFNFYWPPMHRREVLAAGGGSLTDTLHIAWSLVTLFLMMILMGFGAAALKKRFRLYTIFTFLVFIIFGILSFLASPAMEQNQPTPLIGLWERINIAAFMLWVIVFAIILLRTESSYHLPGDSMHKTVNIINREEGINAPSD
jgi:hypothetical protein